MDYNSVLAKRFNVPNSYGCDVPGYLLYIWVDVEHVTAIRASTSSNIA